MVIQNYFLTGLILVSNTCYIFDSYYFYISFYCKLRLYDEIINKNIDIVVGSIGILSTAMQTFNGSLNYGKSEAHTIYTNMIYCI